MVETGFGYAANSPKKGAMQIKKRQYDDTPESDAPKIYRPTKCTSIGANHVIMPVQCYNFMGNEDRRYRQDTTCFVFGEIWIETECLRALISATLRTEGNGQGFTHSDETVALLSFYFLS